MDVITELKQDYAALAELLADTIGSDYGDALSGYIAACWMKIWSGNKLYAPKYAKAIGCVLGREPSMEQCLTVLSCCGDETRKLDVPALFHQLVACDATQKTGAASDFLAQLNHILVAGASCNGDFTIEEANAVTAILKSLVACAKKAKLPVKDVPHISDPITPLKEESYLRPAAKPDVQGSTPTAEVPTFSIEDSDEKDNSITLHVSLDLSDLTDTHKDASPAAPEKLAVPPEAKSSETLESLLAELDSLVGLDSVKQDVHSLMNFIKVTKIREARGMKIPTISYHLVFTGNPGTGKTTVARLVAKLYYQMGILPKGQLVEADRSALVAGYVGQTAIKTQQVIQQALGGVLFIDEAYSLANDSEQDSYGKEAIETILKAMEDHRNELVVIVAGYDDLMHKFIDSNPGLSSRFSKYFHFPDYTGEELLKIFERFCKTNGYTLESGVEESLLKTFTALYDTREEHFGNARAIRNIFEKAINCQADRIAGQSSFTDTDLETLTAVDLENAIKKG